MFTNKLALAKTAVRFASALGSSKIVHDIIQNNCTVSTTADKVKVAIGSVVIGSMIADHVSSYVDVKFDELVLGATELKNLETK